MVSEKRHLMSSDPHAPRPRFHFHSKDCYGMGPGDTEVLVCGLKTETDMDWADPPQGDPPAQMVEQAEMLEAFADRVDKFWSPLKLDMENNAKFAEALRAGAACLRPSGQQERRVCQPCRETGAIHCAHPDECGGPWSDPLQRTSGQQEEIARLNPPAFQSQQEPKK